MAYLRPKPPAGGIKAAFPGFIEPALATSIEKVPSGERWIHEIKFDGYRVQVHLANEAVKVFTRRGHDWTNRFRKIAHDAWHINAGSAIIDGEVVVPAADGTTDFSVLQNELKGQVDKDRAGRLRSALSQRPRPAEAAAVRAQGRLLKKIIAGTDVQFSESFEVDGREMFTHACKVGLEGVVSKVRDSRYPSGRSQRLGEEDLRAAGDADHRRLRARRKQVGRALSSAGARATTWSTPARSTTASTRPRPPICRQRLKPLIRKTQPYSKRIAHEGIWVEPSLLAEIEYRAKSAEGKVRHPFFKGIREDL